MKTLIVQLERDQYDESEGSPEDRAYRRGWNAGVKHAISRARVELGLVEFRRSCTFANTAPEHPSVHELFDIGGEA
jgi:hypothetical protein